MHLRSLALLLVVVSGCDTSAPIPLSADDSGSRDFSFGDRGSTDLAAGDRAVSSDAEDEDGGQACPTSFPGAGETCSDEGQRCEVGEECCCGECHPSLICTCGGGRWACLYSDACFGAQCPDAGDPDSGRRDTGLGDSGAADPINCGAFPPLFPAFDRTCQAEEECTIGTRQSDCCGTQIVTGIRHSEAVAFRAAASVCSMQFPGCGCAPQPTQADDGTTYSGAPASVSCTGGMCRSTFPSSGMSTPCGNQLTCGPATQVCVRREIGPGFTFSCETAPPGCFENHSCGCTETLLCQSPADLCIDDDRNRITCSCPVCS